MATPGGDRRIPYLVLNYLNSLRTDSNAENIDTACQCISAALNVDINSTSEFQEFSLYPLSLDEIVDAGTKASGASTYSALVDQFRDDPKFRAFSDTCSKKGYFKGVEEGSIEYFQRNAKLVKKYKEKTIPATQPSGAATVVASAETAAVSAPIPEGKQGNEAMAEERKQAGNVAIQKKDFELAVQLYSEALQYSADGPNSHIYYANRSAAYSHLLDYKNALSDAQSSIRLSPNYAKAYSRLGAAYFGLGNYKTAVDAFQSAVDLEPSNKTSKDSLDQAKQRLQEHESLATTPASGAPGGLGAGMPGLSSLAGMMGGNSGGFMQMAQQMMQNPAFMQQAQQMMQDPTFMSHAQQMMQNPGAMQQAMAALGGGGAGGGMPDLAAMTNMMNAMGGGAGGGGSPGIPPFSGFNN